MNTLLPNINPLYNNPTRRKQTLKPQKQPKKIQKASQLLNHEPERN